MADHGAADPPDSSSAGGFGGADGDVSPALLRALAAHPADMADLIEALHRRVYNEDTLLDLMGRASREAVRLIHDAHWAGVTAQFAGTPFTAAHTDSRVLIVDEGQYGQGDGPCLTAMRTNEPVAMTSVEVRERWPKLALIADRAGVQAYRAEPLHARDSSVGSLNLYSARAEGLRDADPDVLTVLTEYLDRGLTDYSAAQPGEADAAGIQDRLRVRRTINQAIGILMALNPMDAPAAAALLDRQAGDLGRPVQDVAADLVVEHTTNRSPPGTPDAAPLK